MGIKQPSWWSWGYQGWGPTILGLQLACGTFTCNFRKCKTERKDDKKRCFLESHPPHPEGHTVPSRPCVLAKQIGHHPQPDARFDDADCPLTPHGCLLMQVPGPSRGVCGCRGTPTLHKLLSAQTLQARRHRLRLWESHAPSGPGILTCEMQRVAERVAQGPMAFTRDEQPLHAKALHLEASSGLPTNVSLLSPKAAQK